MAYKSKFTGAEIDARLEKVEQIEIDGGTSTGSTPLVIKLGTPTFDPENEMVVTALTLTDEEKAHNAQVSAALLANPFGNVVRVDSTKVFGMDGFLTSTNLVNSLIVAIVDHPDSGTSAGTAMVNFGSETIMLLPDGNIEIIKLDL